MLVACVMRNLLSYLVVKDCNYTGYCQHKPQGEENKDRCPSPSAMWLVVIQPGNCGFQTYLG